MKPVYKIRQKSTGLYCDQYGRFCSKRGHTWVRQSAADSQMMFNPNIDRKDYEVVKFELQEVKAENCDDIYNREYNDGVEEND